MYNLNTENNHSFDEQKNNKNNTLSGVFSFIGFIVLSIVLVIELQGLENFIYYGLLEQIGQRLSEIQFWSITKFFLLFTGFILNMTALVLAIIELNKKVISRDRLFIHISFLIINVLFFIIHFI